VIKSKKTQEREGEEGGEKRNKYEFSIQTIQTINMHF
jgi:hypothetical protein